SKVRVLNMLECLFDLEGFLLEDMVKYSIVPGGVRMYADRNFILLVPLTFPDDEVFVSGGNLFKNDKIKQAVRSVQAVLGFLFDQVFLFQSVSHQIFDGNQLEIVFLCDLYEGWKAGHGAVLVQDFDQNPCR